MPSPSPLSTGPIAPNSRRIDRYKPLNRSLKCECSEVCFATFCMRVLRLCARHVIRNIVSPGCLIPKAARRGAISNSAPPRAAWKTRFVRKIQFRLIRSHIVRCIDRIQYCNTSLSCLLHCKSNSNWIASQSRKFVQIEGCRTSLSYSGGRIECRSKGGSIFVLEPRAICKYCRLKCDLCFWSICVEYNKIIPARGASNCLIPVRSSVFVEITAGLVRSYCPCLHFTAFSRTYGFLPSPSSHFHILPKWKTPPSKWK